MIKKKYIYLLFGIFILSCNYHQEKIKPFPFTESFSPSQRSEMERRLYADPFTGKIPSQIRKNEIEFVSHLPRIEYSSLRGLDGNPWKHTGPPNVGGRTRSVIIDQDNPDILYTGGVSGGIWKSTDAGKTWTRKTKPNDLFPITCIAQNPKKPDILYAGTGEGSGSSASETGAYYLGDGLMKSIDRGETWTSVAKTKSGTPNSFNTWDIIWKVICMPYDTGDVIYSAIYGGIYRSNNGGKNFIRVLGQPHPATSAQSYYTDINIGSSGILYATLSSEGQDAGIWRCDNDKTWKRITPPGFPKNFQRIVSGIAPSDQNTVYFLANYVDSAGKKSTDFRKNVEYNGLWKYIYTGDTTSPYLGTWTDLSANLPDFDTQFGKFFTQHSYDMSVAIKPDDKNCVILGGTNVWRSTSGFSDSLHTTWIGGYGVNTTLPDFKMYPNHHPDIHHLLFYKNFPDKMISACDGGLFKTDSILANQVSWISLNTQFLTTQFYTVSIDHDVAGNTVMGGLQDNGTYHNPSAVNPNRDWNMSFSGDGSFCFVPDGAPFLYVSKQEGKIYKIEVDAEGLPLKYIRIDPKMAPRTYQFINPFAVDRKNPNRMYLPCGDRIYRNNDLSVYKPVSVLDSTASDSNWVLMSNTILPGKIISAVTISQSNNDVVFFGTSQGKLYRIRNASVGDPTVEEITGTGFPPGNINCIATHPVDTNLILAVFTNYNINSLFYSRNGGISWINVSGNLEQFPDGTGNGPSCRWADVLPFSAYNAWFVATSAGLFSTDSLIGNQTRWVMQGAENMGAVPCNMIDIHPAKRIVYVATHGAGMFEAKITDRFQVTGVLSENKINSKFYIYPNPSHDKIYINRSNQSIKSKLNIYNFSGVKVDEYIWQAGQSEIIVNISSFRTGVYFLEMDGIIEKLVKY